jgi:hypothetical protein
MLKNAKTYIRRVNNSLVLPCHLTVVTEFVFFVNGHYVGLCCNHNHVVTVLVIVVHGTVVESKSVFLVVYVVPAVGVHEDAEALYANTAKNTEHFPLVLVELGWWFTAEGKKIFIEESLDASKRKMRQAGAVVEERMNAGHGEIGAVAKMHSFKYAGCNRSTGADLLGLGQCEYTTVCDSGALDQTDALELGKSSKLHDRGVGESITQCEINVAYAVAKLD